MCYLKKDPALCSHYFSSDKVEFIVARFCVNSLWEMSDDDHFLLLCEHTQLESKDESEKVTHKYTVKTDSPSLWVQTV